MFPGCIACGYAIAFLVMTVIVIYSIYVDFKRKERYEN